METSQASALLRTADSFIGHLALNRTQSLKSFPSIRSQNHAYYGINFKKLPEGI